MTARTMTISVGKRAVAAVVCPGTEAQHCGTLLTHPGECPWRHCRRYMSEAEYHAAIAAAEAGERAA